MSLRASRELQSQVVRYAQAMHSKGWVANHDGNISARVADKRFLATPTATSKEDVCLENLLETDETGTKIAGSSRRFSEINLHLAVYEARPDVSTVIHAHPPNATAIACSGRNLIETPFIAEAIVSLGQEIPLVPFAAPGPAAATALAPYLGRVDAVLLANHGVLAWGQNPEQAYLRLELVEHLAKIAVAAEPLGGVKPLPRDCIPPLLAARAKAGLGAAADAAGPKTVIACAPAPHSPVQVAQKSSALARTDSEAETLLRIVREEIVRTLSRE